MSKTPSESDIKKMRDKASMASARALDVKAKEQQKKQKEREARDRTRMWEVLKVQEASAKADASVSPNTKKGGQKHPDTGEDGARKRNYSDTGE